MIQRLRTNLKSEVPINIELPQRLVLVGRTGAGKSTIPDAIEFALSGEVGNVYGKHGLTKDGQLLISMAPSTEPDRLFVDAKSDDGLKVHREVTRLDGTLKRMTPVIPASIESTLDKSLPLRLVTQALSSGAASRQRFIWGLVEPYLTDEDREQLSALNVSKMEDGRLDLSTLTSQLDKLGRRLRESRDGLKAAIEAKESTADILHAREEALSQLGPADTSALEQELAEVTQRLDADSRIRSDVARATRRLGSALAQEQKRGPVACPTCMRPWALPAATDGGCVESAESGYNETINSVDETLLLDELTRIELDAERRRLHNIVMHRSNIEGSIRSFRKQLEDAIEAEVRFGRETAELKASIQQLKSMMSSGIAAATAKLIENIDSYLPAGWASMLYQDGGRGDMSFGLLVNGHFRPTISGGQTAILHTAIAMCLPVVNSMTFIAVPDADIDDETLSEMMESFAHWQGQVIITQTKGPSRSVPGWEVRRVK